MGSGRAAETPPAAGLDAIRLGDATDDRAAVASDWADRIPRRSCTRNRCQDRSRPAGPDCSMNRGAVHAAAARRHMASESSGCTGCREYRWPVATGRRRRDHNRAGWWRSARGNRRRAPKAARLSKVILWDRGTSRRRWQETHRTMSSTARGCVSGSDAETRRCRKEYSSGRSFTEPTPPQVNSPPVVFPHRGDPTAAAADKSVTRRRGIRFGCRKSSSVIRSSACRIMRPHSVRLGQTISSPCRAIIMSRLYDETRVAALCLA